MSSFWVLVGSFSPLISVLSFTVSPPTLSLIKQTPVGNSPSWILGHPQNSSIVYATDEVDAGSITSLIFDETASTLTPVAKIPTQGGGPTHLGLVANGRVLGAANFGGGSAFFANLDNDLLGFTGGQLVQFPTSTAQPSHAHEVVAFSDNEVFVPDLGRDQVFRLGLQLGSWVIQDSVPQDRGSGPRHIALVGSTLYTLHEKASSLTQHNLSPVNSAVQSLLVANLSIVPPDTSPAATLAGGELLFAPSPEPLLYASNRDDPHPNGDAIAIFQITPQLTRVAEIRTGLKHLRGVSFLGDNNQFLLAAGLNGGGIKVFERVSASQGFLREVASLPEGMVDQPTSFVSIPATPNPVAVPSFTGIGTATAIVNTQPSLVGVSAAKRRIKFWF